MFSKDEVFEFQLFFDKVIIRVAVTVLTFLHSSLTSPMSDIVHIAECIIPQINVKIMSLASKVFPDVCHSMKF